MAQLGIAQYVTRGLTSDLTAIGTDDWFNYPGTTTINRKAGANKLAIALIAGTTSPAVSGTYYPPAPSVHTWSDGTPTASGSSNNAIRAAVGAGQLDKGWTITAPAGTGVRTLKVLVGAYISSVKISASLSDGSAAAVTDTWVTNDAQGDVKGFTLTYAAASEGQTLTVLVVNATGVAGSEIGLQAVTLSLPAGGGLTCTLGWTEGADSIALAGTVSAPAAGSFNTPPLRNNTGSLLANETGVTVNVYNSTTGALVVRKTGLTSNASGVVTVSDAAVVAGTSYAYEVVLAANGRRLPLATAA